MQISYHYALTKIQKLQNLKKKKKISCTGWYARYRPVLPEIGRYGRYFFRYETGRLYVPVCLPLQYIPAILAGMVRNWLSWLIKLLKRHSENLTIFYYYVF